MMPRGASEVSYGGSFGVGCALCWVSVSLWSSFSLLSLLSLPFGMRIFAPCHCVLEACDILFILQGFTAKSFP